MTVTVLDTVTSVTPLGVRFVDEPTGATIRDGLRVAYERASGRTHAQTNRIGVYLVSGLPGIAPSERGAGDDAFWANPPASGSTTVEVVDELGRFLPFRFDADVPFRGPFFTMCGSPGSPPAGPLASVPLFSAPSRRPPASAAALRLELWDADAAPLVPASWAFVEVRTAGGQRLGSGFADERGSLLVPFAYPPLPATPGAPRSLTSQTWTVRLRAAYSRLPATPSRPHDLCDLLEQAPATLLASESPRTALPDPTLDFGRELTATTHGHNVLLVSAP